jgi:hypothetical protein
MEIRYQLEGIGGLVILFLIGVIGAILLYYVYNFGKSKGRLEGRVEALEKKIED